MTDLVQTAANVAPVSGVVADQAYAGEALVAGDQIYLDATGKWLKGDANSATASQRKATHTAMNGAALGQSVVGARRGRIKIGATVAVGMTYFLSDTAGKVMPQADLSTGEYPTLIGIGVSTTDIELIYKSVDTAAA